MAINVNEVAELLGLLYPSSDDLKLFAARAEALRGGSGLRGSVSFGAAPAVVCAGLADQLQARGLFKGALGDALVALLLNERPGQEDEIRRVLLEAPVGASPAGSAAQRRPLVQSGPAIDAAAGPPVGAPPLGGVAGLGPQAASAPVVGTLPPALMPPPRASGDGVRVLISYAHETGDSRVAARVAELAAALRSEGIDAWIDQYMLPGGPAEGWPRWMDRMVREANFVVCVCTPTWAKRVEGREALEVGKGVAWEGNLLYNILYDAKLVSEKIVLVTLDGFLSELPLVLLGRHVHLWASGHAALVQTLKGQRAPIPPLGRADSLPPSDRPRSPSAQAVEFAMKLLAEVLRDPKVLEVVRIALNLSSVASRDDALQAIRDGAAVDLVFALSEAHRRTVEDRGYAAGLELDRATMRLLPFVGDWARFIEETHTASANPNGSVRLRLNDIRVAELVVAGADQRGVQLRRVGDSDELEPVLMLPLSQTIDAYRADASVVRSMTGRQVSAYAGSPFGFVAERVAQLEGMAGDLGRAFPSAARVLDEVALEDWEEVLREERRAPPTERRTWAVVVEGSEDAATEELWSVVRDTLAPLPSLRLVRLYGDRKDRVEGAKGAFVHILNMMKRKENT